MFKKSSEFKFAVNYDWTDSKPCIKKRCDGFMFPILMQYYQDGPVFDEFECYNCRAKHRIKELRKPRRENRDD